MELKAIFIKISLLFFLFGCTNHNIYEKVEDKSFVGKLQKFTILASSPELLKLSKSAIKDTNIHISKSPYTIVVESSAYPAHCNNPLNISSESRFDGYVKITIKKAFHKIYTIQADFYDDVNEDIIVELLQKMKKDMKIK